MNYNSLISHIVTVTNYYFHMLVLIEMYYQGKEFSSDLKQRTNNL